MNTQQESQNNAQQQPTAGNPSPTLQQLSERKSPQSMNADSHSAKMNRMEAPAEQGFAGGIPPKIEEGVEM